MTLVAFTLSLLIAALGALGVVAPARLLAIARSVQRPGGLYAAAALRLVLGVSLVFAAPTSRAPGLIRIVGLVTIVAGLITPLFGLDRFRRILDWWSARGPTFMRAWAAFALGFGLLLAWVVAP